jgi:hypothetical protein
MPTVLKLYVRLSLRQKSESVQVSISVVIVTASLVQTIAIHTTMVPENTMHMTLDTRPVWKIAKTVIQHGIVMCNQLVGLAILMVR